MEDKAMQNFEFYAPTRMIFGKDTHKQVGKLVKEYGFKKVFVHFSLSVRNFLSWFFYVFAFL